MRSPLLSLTFLVCTACGPSYDPPEADLTNADTVKELAIRSSAASMQALLFGIDVPDPDDAVTCPPLVEDGEEMVFEGDCIDDGRAVSGTVRMVDDRNVDGSVTITLERFEEALQVRCDAHDVFVERRLDGTLMANEDGSFEMDLRIRTNEVDEDCIASEPRDIRIVYAGNDHDEGLSGSGTLSHEVYGTVQAETENQVLGTFSEDDCQSEAESGTTTLRANGHEAVITYDGATDCDPEGTVTWTLDGEAKGEFAGVHCSTAGSPVGLGVLLAALGLMGLRRRRRG